MITASMVAADVVDCSNPSLAAEAIHNGHLCILSDDMDLATFAGLTLDTANRTTLAAARSAGRLL